MAVVFDELMQFCASFFSDWVSKVSGGLSVLSTVVAFACPSLSTKIIFAILATIAFIFSSYRVWRKEHRKVVELEERMRPKLNVSFNMQDDGCVLLGPAQSPEFKAFRLKVEAVGLQRVTACRGHLRSICSGSRNFNSQSVILPFAPSELEEAASKSINPGSAEFLDLIRIRNNNEIEIHSYQEHLPNNFNQTEFFGNQGVYVFDVSVSSANSVSVNCKIRMNWLGDWKTASMELTT